MGTRLRCTRILEKSTGGRAATRRGPCRRVGKKGRRVQRTQNLPPEGRGVQPPGRAEAEVSQKRGFALTLFLLYEDGLKALAYV